MATRIVLPIRSIEGAGSAAFDVQETFQEVIDKLAPKEQPTPEEVHANLTFTMTNGKRIFMIPPERAWWAEEL